MTFLPKNIEKLISPPIKIQGIKTKLIPMIAQSIKWNGEGIWIEPFFGSGSVAFNIKPERAILCDTNKHIVKFYNDIKNHIITPQIVENYFIQEGNILLKKGDEYYYDVRERFNNQHNSLDFLFLNRFCYGGIMRFNREGKFNVSFCKFLKRANHNYYQKIANQIDVAQRILQNKDWTFITQDWRKTLEIATENDLVYCDPPYMGLHTTYYNDFSDTEGDVLARKLINSSINFALSMWLENKDGRNPFINKWFSSFKQETTDHHYFINNDRYNNINNKIIEVLILSDNIYSKPKDKTTYSSLFDT